MSKGTWQNEWPKEKGLWWFYGWRFGKIEGRNLELCLVKVNKTAQPNTFMYVTHGHFLYREEGTTGMWQRAILPELPELEEVLG